MKPINEKTNELKTGRIPDDQLEGVSGGCDNDAMVSDTHVGIGESLDDILNKPVELGIPKTSNPAHTPERPIRVIVR